MRRVLILLGLLLGLPLGLPVAAHAQENGKGELWLHESVMEYYEEFKRDFGGHYFAVSTNGISAGYSYCKSFNACPPLDGKRQALSSCNSSGYDLPGTCYIFANRSKIVWQGQIHVLTHEQFMARLYGPGSVEESLAGFVEHVAGMAEGAPATLLPSRQVWQRSDFRFAPADLAFAGDECRYAFDELYQTNVARNLFLLDASGLHCAFSTGFAAADETAAFERALAACEELAGSKGGTCYVYAAGGELLAGRSKL